MGIAQQIVRLSFFAFVVGWMSLDAVSQTVNKLSVVTPDSAGLNGDRLMQIDAITRQGIADGKMPGCVVAVGRRGKLAYLRAFGHRQIQPEIEPMTTDTVFDLASLTKPIATATSVMILVERDKLDLDSPVAKYLPEFATAGKKAVTIRHLLLHTSGLTPDNALADYDDGKQKALERINELGLRATPGEKFIYSDVGFIILAKIVERVSGKNVHEFSQANVFQPLGMVETGFLPPKNLHSRCATTQQREGRWMKGEVHDPRAYRLGGIAGHAGLFSTAADLSVYAQMLLGQGKFGDTKIMEPSTIFDMTRSFPVNHKTGKIGWRGLGWDKRSAFSSNRAHGLSGRAYGHGGFTGTALWIDPAQELFYIFLSNRVHPDGKGSVNRLIREIGNIALDAIEREQTLVETKTGLDNLADQDFAMLRGKRVGLITNHTGIDRRGRRNVDLMHDSANANLVAIFSPEHGLSGIKNASVADSRDAKTGLPIYSLYGANRKPTKPQLEQLDCLVFDIQDIGTRFYTYISTMGLAMQAADDAGVEFVVLDRPNPIGGVEVDGPMLDADKKSFVGFHRLPVQHGMTVGELAQMFQQEKGLELDLSVVPVTGWKRSQQFDETGLLWVNPSPNIRNLNQALLYPGIGLLETTNLSVGRGTDTPFEVVGAPWMDGQRVAAALNQFGMTGVSFIPRNFTPRSNVYAGKQCGGLNILITNRETVRPVEIGMILALILRDLYPNKWNVEGYRRLLGNAEVFEAIKLGRTMPQIRYLYQRELSSYIQRRSGFLIYD